VIDTEALRVPVAVGWNVNVSVQLPLAATELPQLFVSVKSEGFVPATEMLVILKAVLPTLVSVTVWGALVCPTAIAGNDSLVADNLTSVPKPLTAIDCGLPLASSLISTEALRVPAAVGWKVTLIPQCAPAATELPHVFVCVKSDGFAPPNEIPVMVRVAVPVLANVTVVALVLWPRSTAPENVTLEGDNCTCAPLLVAPVPVRLIVSGLPAALSAMVTVPVRVPVVVGWKVTLIVQLEPAATEVPQVLVWA
jgi:hypothetical protein